LQPRFGKSDDANFRFVPGMHAASFDGDFALTGWLMVAKKNAGTS
jgi:hypothetical protein